jgi:hypothetical protein
MSSLKVIQLTTLTRSYFRPVSNHFNSPGLIVIITNEEYKTQNDAQFLTDATLAITFLRSFF